MSDAPFVLFLCVHNAGRSQMALGFVRHLAGERVRSGSAGSAPAEMVNSVAVEAMREVGIDITGATPMRWDDAMVESADVVVTMGCGDTCPVFPATRYEDWDCDDPAGQPIEAVRAIRVDIEARVRELLTSLGVSPPDQAPDDAASG